MPVSQKTTAQEITPTQACWLQCLYHRKQQHKEQHRHRPADRNACITENNSTRNNTDTDLLIAMSVSQQTTAQGTTPTQTCWSQCLYHNKQQHKEYHRHKSLSVAQLHDSEPTPFIYATSTHLSHFTIHSSHYVSRYIFAALCMFIICCRFWSQSTFVLMYLVCIPALAEIYGLFHPIFLFTRARIWPCLKPVESTPHCLA